MTQQEMEKRLTALEEAVSQLQRQGNGEQIVHSRWWATAAGRFANDPVFDEIVRLGREHRESLRPGTRKGRKKTS